MGLFPMCLSKYTPTHTYNQREREKREKEKRKEEEGKGKKGRKRKGKALSTSPRLGEAIVGSLSSRLKKGNHSK